MERDREEGGGLYLSATRHNPTIIGSTPSASPYACNKQTHISKICQAPNMKTKIIAMKIERGSCGLGPSQEERHGRGTGRRGAAAAKELSGGAQWAEGRGGAGPSAGRERAGRGEE